MRASVSAWSLLALHAALAAFPAHSPGQGPVYTGPCTRRTDIVLSEIMYAPAGDPAVTANLEFIELYNSSPISEDLSGWTLRGSVDYTFPAGTRLAGGQFLTISAAPAVLTAAGAAGTVLGPWTGILPNGTGTVRLVKASGGIVLETDYRDDPPWPLAADGGGHSLVLARPAYGESRPEAWSASAASGGSPGTVDPRTLTPTPATAPERVVISEILASSHPAGADFAELFNPGPGAADLSGCRLSPDRALPGYQIPAGTVLAAGSYLAFMESTLGFSPDDSGGDLFLRAPDGLKVLAARRYAGQDRGRSHGPVPVLSGSWQELAAPTPGAVNALPLQRPVVINEIHYHPAGDDDGAEFLELHNQSPAPADLTGWQLADGVSFAFPPGTAIAPGGFLVIAKDRTRLLTLQPALPPALVLGNYAGTLNNGGERVALTFSRTGSVPGPTGPVPKTWQVTADEVTYADGGRWPAMADGGGTSLQLIDPRADNNLAPSWRAADESAKATTVTVEHTGVLDLGHPITPSATRFFLMLGGTGQAIVDDVEVLTNGQNRIANGTFAGGSAGWSFFGTHSPSLAQNGALRLTATDEGDLANLAETTLSSAIPAGTAAVTLRARVRWVSGDPQILLGLNGGLLEAPATLPVPTNAGTPGTANAGSGNTGPAITEVSHFPLLPQAGEAITITARVSDPDNITAVRVRYRLDPAISLTQVAMADDGATYGDARAGDGIYTARLPAHTTGAMIGYHLTAIDSAIPGVITLFPADAPVRECHIRVGEVTPPGVFGTTRLWLTRASHDSWRDRTRSSNLDIDATFVSQGRVIHNVGVSYAGSQNGVTIYDSPTGAACGYNITLPSDEVFLNVQKMTLDRETTRDATRQRERLMFWFLEKLGLPNLHRRYVHVYLNGSKRDQLIMEDVQKPNSDVMRQWFDGDGRLTKMNPWFEFNAASALQTSSSQANRLAHFRTTGDALKLPRYRRTWSHAAGHASWHDFSGISTLIDAAAAPDASLAASLQPHADLRQWMRTFAMNDLASFWDTFGNPGAKNAYLYESPATRRWSVVTWDMDVGLGVFNDPVEAPLFAAGVDPAIVRLYDRPEIVRDYWQALDESMGSFFNAGPGSAAEGILTETYNALAANGAAVTSPFVPSGAYGLSVAEWITARRAFLTTQLAGKNPAFTASGPATSATALTTLSGTGPLATDSISVNGTPLSLTWTGLNTWTAQTALLPGSNTLLLGARNRAGSALGSATLTIQSTAAPVWTALRINEVMAANPAANFPDPADNKSDDWLELHNPSAANVSLEGWYLSDQPANPRLFRVPAGFFLPARGFLLVWADDESFQNAPALRPDLHLPFKLSTTGETLILSAPDGTEIDRLILSPQASGIALRRSPDGGTSTGFSLTASPGAANPPLPAPALPGLLHPAAEAGSLTFQCATAAGGLYQVETSPDLSVWTPSGPPFAGTGGVLPLQRPAPPVPRFFIRIHSY
jgi:CotH kinase protein/Lamin Tail Domain